MQRPGTGSAVKRVSFHEAEHSLHTATHCMPCSSNIVRLFTVSRRPSQSPRILARGSFQAAYEQTYYIITSS